MIKRRREEEKHKVNYASYLSPNFSDKRPRKGIKKAIKDIRRVSQMQSTLDKQTFNHK